MPELPEAEVVRRGLARWVAGRTVEAVEVLDGRSVRRHSKGAEDFADRLTGARVLDAARRGKFLWMPVIEDAGSKQPRTAIMVHLGMSGQLLVEEPSAPTEKHLKVRLTLSVEPGFPSELRFVDQRIFGGIFLAELIPTTDGLPGGESAANLPLVPLEAAHIARDPLDPGFSFDAFYAKLRLRRTGLKRALLDQRLVSGIGNIYADEALWSAGLHYARATDTLRRSEAVRLIAAVQQVMGRALEAGGTSFDSLYVNVNGASGYFSRSLEAYGRAGEPCRRCLAAGRESRLLRETFMNRSSFTCPACQPRPRNGRW